MELKNIIELLHLAVKSAVPIKHLIEAGTPVAQALHQQAPELGAAIKELVAANAPPEPTKQKTTAPALSHEQAVEAVAKAIFTPHKIDPHEQAWMDRASSTSFG